MRSPCCSKPDSSRGAWSEEEDQKLVDCIRMHGQLVSWRSIPEAAGLLRCGKSCRLRWINYLRPNVKRGNFEEDEEDLIVRLHALLGNRWSLIAGRLPGRMDNEVENHWNSHLKKRLRSTGVDPDKHRLFSTYDSSPSHPPPQSCLSSRSGSTESGTGDRRRLRAGTSERRQQDSSSHNTAGLPDLNLDLTISPPYSIAERRPGSAGFAEAETETETTRLENAGKLPVTLSLFR